MAVTFVTRTIGGLSKSVFVVDANAGGEADDEIILAHDCLPVDISYLKLVDASAGANFTAKLTAYTLPNGVNALEFFTPRIFVQSVLAAKYEKVAASQDVPEQIVALDVRVTAAEAAIEALDVRVTDLETP